MVIARTVKLGLSATPPLRLSVRSVPWARPRLHLDIPSAPLVLPVPTVTQGVLLVMVIARTVTLGFSVTPRVRPSVTSVPWARLHILDQQLAIQYLLCDLPHLHQLCPT